MCVLDALTLNPDRHYGNFGVLFDTDTMDILGMALVFDNNRSLFPELDDEQVSNPEWYLKKCRPRLGTDFILNVQGLLTPEIRDDLKSLVGFHFQQHNRISASECRLERLSQLVNAQIHRIINA